MARCVLLAALLVLTLTCTGSGETPDGMVMPLLERYIAVGLENNLSLQQNHLSYTQRLQKLREARALFFPSLGFSARYSRAGGGRTVEIPVGDLINPVYANLNQQLGEARFPEDLGNEVIRFLRKDEYETRLRLTQQVFNARVRNNYRLNLDQVDIQQAELQVVQRQLVKEIKVAYFNYLNTAKVAELYEQTLKLLSENRRVTQKLFEADKVTRDATYRADTEYYRVEQRLHTASNQNQTARSFFNFLLNQPLETSVSREEVPFPASRPKFDLDGLKQDALDKREEVRQLQAAVRAAGHAVNIAEGDFLPSVSVVADYGFQSESFRLSGEDDYWMISGVLQWNFFNGAGGREKVSRARTEVKRLQSRLAETRRRVELQIQQQGHNLLSAYDRLTVAGLARKSARENFRMVSRKYEEGIASQVAYLDARTVLTSAEIDEILALYTYHIQLAELEMITAAYDFQHQD